MSQADTDMRGTEQDKGAADRVGEIADKLTAQASEYGEKAQEAARQFKPFVEQSLKDQPMTTLAAAVAVGLLLGALWKR